MGILGRREQPVQRPGLMYLEAVRRSESPGHRGNPRLAWLECGELAEHRRGGDPVQVQNQAGVRPRPQFMWEMGSGLGPQVRP